MTLLPEPNLKNKYHYPIGRGRIIIFTQNHLNDPRHELKGIKANLDQLLTLYNNQFHGESKVTFFEDEDFDTIRQKLDEVAHEEGIENFKFLKIYYLGHGGSRKYRIPFKVKSSGGNMQVHHNIYCEYLWDKNRTEVPSQFFINYVSGQQGDDGSSELAKKFRGKPKVLVICACRGKANSFLEKNTPTSPDGTKEAKREGWDLSSASTAIAADGVLEVGDEIVEIPLDTETTQQAVCRSDSDLDMNNAMIRKLYQFQFKKNLINHITAGDLYQAFGNDFAIIQSTSPNSTSWVSSENGFWFIEKFCKISGENAKSKDFEWIIDKVFEEVGNYCVEQLEKVELNGQVQYQRLNDLKLIQNGGKEIYLNKKFFNDFLSTRSGFM